MEYDLRAIVAEALKEYLPLIASGKDRFTAEDIAERYGIHKDNARRMMNNGDFGEVISITPRNKVVTLEGLLAYEDRKKGLVTSKPERSQRNRKTRATVGRI